MRSVRWLIDHLEGPMGAHVQVCGEGGWRMGPRHEWRPIAADTSAMRCARCGLSRFTSLDSGTLFQRQNGRLLMGAEPRRKRRRA